MLISNQHMFYLIQIVCIGNRKPLFARTAKAIVPWEPKNGSKSRSSNASIVAQALQATNTAKSIKRVLKYNPRGLFHMTKQFFRVFSLSWSCIFRGNLTKLIKAVDKMRKFVYFLLSIEELELPLLRNIGRDQMASAKRL